MSRTPPTSQPMADFEPCPEGAHNAVVVDVSEPYEVDQTWEGKTTKVWKRHVAWQVSKRMTGEDGKPGLRYVVMERYTDSISTKSKLRPVILSIIGRAFTNDEEFFGFEMDALVGKPCLVQVKHNEVKKDDKVNVYANVTGVLALPDEMTPIVAEDWTRWQDREPDKRPKFLQNMKPRSVSEANPDDEFNAASSGPDSDIPF